MIMLTIIIVHVNTTVIIFTEEVLTDHGMLKISGFILYYSLDCVVRLALICIVFAGDVECNSGPASRRVKACCYRVVLDICNLMLLSV